MIIGILPKEGRLSMKLKSVAKYGLALAALGSSFFSFAENTTPSVTAKHLIIEENDIYDPDARKKAERHAALEKFEKTFNFDWSQSATINHNKQRIAEIEMVLKKINDHSTLDKEDQRLVGDLSYKLGTFYTHVAQEPNLAIDKLNLAQTLLSAKEAKTLCDSQLAYAYEQKYAVERLTADKDKALYYSSKVITDLHPQIKNKEVAFAYSVKGHIQNDTNEYNQAEAAFKMALAIYDSLPNGKDDFYIRTKSKLADTILEQNHRDKEALTLLEGLNEYWQSKGNASQNPYAAGNLVSLGKAYLKTGNIKEAQAAIKQAISIIETVYGAGSLQMVKPYELLAQTYKKAGDQKLSDAYGQKAAAIARG